MIRALLSPAEELQAPDAFRIKSSSLWAGTITAKLQPSQAYPATRRRLGSSDARVKDPQLRNQGQRQKQRRCPEPLRKYRMHSVIIEDRLTALRCGALVARGEGARGFADRDNPVAKVFQPLHPHRLAGVEANTPAGVSGASGSRLS